MHDETDLAGPMRVTRALPCSWIVAAVAVAFDILVFAAGLGAQVGVEPVFSTPSDPSANVDSCVTWVSPDGASALLFVTEKDGDRIQVWRAESGEPYAAKPFLGGVPDSSLPGEFDRPNGVWVLYHVPYRDGFEDILVVTDQRNLRVQVFRLPDLTYFGEFGTGEIGKGYGLSWYDDGRDFFVVVSDNIPPDEFPGKIKIYRLRPDGGQLGADLVSAFGSDDGVPRLPNVESILADVDLDRIHVCGDEGGDMNYVFRLDGSYTGITYGADVFQADQEGINLYVTRPGEGYLLVSDQRRGGDPNEFELFDRRSLDHIGSFESLSGGALVTSNTDGCFLEQRPVPGFPNGAFFAVHDDRSVHVYDWTDVAESLGLEIVALDRPARGVSTESGDFGADLVRRALWFHDGSWWGVFPGADRELAIWRYEDGSFRVTQPLGIAGLASVDAAGGSLALFVTDVAAESVARVLFFEYEARRRRYVPSSSLDAFPEVPAVGSTLERERDANGLPGAVWVGWVADGSLQVARADDTLVSWGAATTLGVALESGAPAFAALEESLVVVWSRDDGIVSRAHRNIDPPDTWSDAEVVAPVSDASSLAVATAPGDVLVVSAVSVDASAWIASRSAEGEWSSRTIEGPFGELDCVVDPVAGRLHLFDFVERDGRRIIEERSALLDALGGLETATEVVAYPGVSLNGAFVTASLPATAGTFVVVGAGDDGLAHFFRSELPPRPDGLSPISMQHEPPPGSANVGPGEIISFRLVDDGSGIEGASVRVFADDTALDARVRGVPGNSLVGAALPGGLGATVTIRIEAGDRAEPSNVMEPFVYTLFTGDVIPGPLFRRGDANDDGAVDVSDAVRILLWLFSGAAAPRCESALDADDSGTIAVTDAIAILGFLFSAEAAPPPPGPGCGADPTPGELSCGASSRSCS